MDFISYGLISLYGLGIIFVLVKGFNQVVKGLEAVQKELVKQRLDKEG